MKKFHHSRCLRQAARTIRHPRFRRSCDRSSLLNLPVGLISRRVPCSIGVFVGAGSAAALSVGECWRGNNRCLPGSQPRLKQPSAINDAGFRSCSTSRKASKDHGLSASPFAEVPLQGGVHDLPRHPAPANLCPSAIRSSFVSSFQIPHSVVESSSNGVALLRVVGCRHGPSFESRSDEQ